ncbi:cellulose biosynthesis protein BcsS [Tepidamorphus sp. 3E244]|uniref:cellulose biosynthesis protein BcsS n=1 Tax=Tepidamorphus sp. 3E244 TaxID=3385498 RepID=UPI0038FBF8ED
MRKSLIGLMVAGVLLGAAQSAYAADYNAGYDGGIMPSTGPKIVLFGGVDARERSFYGYGGFVWAPMADLSQDTWLVRGMIGGGSYEYDNPGVVGGEVDGDHIEGDIMLGYQWHLQPGRFSLYAGLNVQDHDHSPNDPSNSTAGSEAGFKVQAELESTYGAPFYYNLSGNYSTANDTYWTQARLGWNMQQFTVGPEVSLAGNDEYDSQRVGVFARYSMDAFSVTGAVGYADVSGTQGGDGVYGSLGFSYAY